MAASQSKGKKGTKKTSASGKRTSSSAKKTKSGTKRSGTAASGRSTKPARTTAKMTKTAKTAKAAKDAATLASRRQIGAIVLFAVSVFLLFLLLIPGGNVWAVLQGVVFGLFGIGSYIWPVLFLYIAIVTSMDRDRVGLSSKIIETSILVVLFCSAVHVVAHAGTDVQYGSDIAAAFQLGKSAGNGGAAGAIFGGALLLLFHSKVASVITIILLMFVMLMLITGTTLTRLFHGVAAPFKKAGSATSQHFEERTRSNEERQTELEKKRQEKQTRLRNERFHFDPNVSLGPEPSDEKPLDDDITCQEEQLTNKKKNRSRKGSGKDKITASPKGKDTAPDSSNSLGNKIFAFQDAEDFGLDPNDSVPFTPDAKAGSGVKAGSAAAAPAAEAETAVGEKQKPEVKLDDLVKKAASRSTNTPAEQTSGPTLSAAAAAPLSAAYRLPPLDCLKLPKASGGSSSEQELRDNAQKLVKVLQSFGVKTTLVDIARGPSVTRYELAPAPGVKISRITGLADDIALNLAASGVRIEAPIPNKAAVGIEVPNHVRETVTLREILDSPKYKRGANKSKLTVALGRDIAGNVCMTDIAKMPHLLIAGTTGSGKSVCLNSMILSMLYNATPEEVRMVMIDPKKVEFSVYNGLPHLLVPVVSDPHKASGALAWAVKEMLSRYKTFSEVNVREIGSYNQLAAMDADRKRMPEIVIFIDELADLMMASPAEVEDSICRVAQMGRAAGIHLVIATQRPSVDVITGLIKANIPSRLSLAVASAVDSRTILDMGGAEKLLGNGDMLFDPVGISKPTRIQGCFTSDAEVEKVVDYIKKEETTEYSEEILQEIEKQAEAAENSGKKNSGSGGDSDSDVLITDAIKTVVEAGQASTTLIQRKLRVGYARAARIVDELEERGIVGPFEGSKPRKVLITKNQWLEMNAMSGEADDGSAAAIDMGLDNKNP